MKDSKKQILRKLPDQQNILAMDELKSLPWETKFLENQISGLNVDVVTFLKFKSKKRFNLPVYSFTG